MFWVSQKAQPTTEPRAEEKKSRFQIVKLEERIAPRRVCYYYRGRRICYKTNNGNHGRV
jgi:hypothetical protein